MMDATFIVTENAYLPSLESLVQIHPFLDFVPANASQGVPVTVEDRLPIQTCELVNAD